LLDKKKIATGSTIAQVAYECWKKEKPKEIKKE
jgi:hypothetical protein